MRDRTCTNMRKCGIIDSEHSDSRRGGNPERLSERQPDWSWRRLMTHFSIPHDLNLSPCHAAPKIGGR